MSLVDTLARNARDHLHAGRLTEAEALLRQALAIAPDDSLALALLGSLLIHRGDPTTAEHVLRRALASNPENTTALINMALLLKRRSQTDEAMALLRMATVLAPWNGAGHFNLGNLLLDRGRKAEAVAAFQQAIRHDPTLASRWATTYAIPYLLRGEHPALLRTFPNHVSVLVALDALTGKAYPDPPLAGEVRVIVDAGANVGAASVLFAERYPTARILSFEPAAATFDLLRQNARPYPTIMPFPVGLFSRAGQERLYKGTTDGATASITHNAMTSEDYEMIELVEADPFLRAQGVDRIDILKVDTEGCELPILDSLRGWLPHVQVLYLEYHSEQDRRAIDRMVEDTHVLCRASTSLPHRGELCYVNLTALPSEDVTRFEVRREKAPA